jgi:hypothetical protein
MKKILKFLFLKSLFESYYKVLPLQREYKTMGLQSAYVKLCAERTKLHYLASILGMIDTPQINDALFEDHK